MVESSKCETAKKAFVSLGPATFWNQDEHHPLLQRVALKVFSMVPTSAASERAWSAMGFLHTKIRNRLKPERVQQMVFLYMNLRLTMKLGLQDSNSSNSFLIGNLIANVEQQNQAEFNNYNPEDFEIQDEEDGDDDFTGSEGANDSEDDEDILTAIPNSHGGDEAEDEALQALFNE
jgi:hypothetical protein